MTDKDIATIALESAYRVLCRAAEAGAFRRLANTENLMIGAMSDIERVLGAERCDEIRRYCYSQHSPARK